MAIRAGTLTDSSLRARPLFTSYRKIIASPQYIAEHGKPETVEELKQHLCTGFTEPVSLNTGPWPVMTDNFMRSLADFRLIAEKR